MYGNVVRPAGSVVAMQKIYKFAQILSESISVLEAISGAQRAEYREIDLPGAY